MKDTKNNNTKILNAKELAEYLKISASTAYNLLRSDDFPTFKIGNRLLVHISNLEKWIDDKSK